MLVVSLLVLLAVIGASAEHGAGSTQLRRGPASVVLSVLITLAMLAGVASLWLLIWGLVTRNRRTLGGPAQRRHSPILVAAVVLMIFAGLSALLALAARRAHLQSFLAAHGRPPSHVHSSGSPLPFNTAASVTTSSVVIGIIAIVVVVKVVRSMGWSRVLRGLHSLRADGEAESNATGGEPPAFDELGRELGALSVADPSTEPDPRRAVIGCYLQMLEVAARHGPERRRTETPSEYLRRMLAMTGVSAAPATSLTGLFERARYSERPVGESMRTEAIAALDALRDDLLAGAVS